MLIDVTNHFEVKNIAAMLMVEFRDNISSNVKHFAYVFLIIKKIMQNIQCKLLLLMSDEKI